MARRARGQVSRASAFWDSSALVPLCVHQNATTDAFTLRKSYDVIVWWSTPVEIAGAISRLVRRRDLDPKFEIEARRMAGNLAASWSVVQPSNGVLNWAMQFITRYDLRAGDSLQLAAAWEWCEGLPSGKTFLTYDQKLRDAALLLGFRIK